MPSRRAVLAGVTGSIIALSGCTALGTPGSDSSETPYEGFRTVTLGEYDSTVEDPPLEITPIVRSPEIDDGSPAYIEVYVENFGEEKLFTDPPIHHYSYPDNEEGITLWYTRGSTRPSEMEAYACLVENMQTPDSSKFGVTHEGWSFSLDPGETHVLNYIVSMDWDVDECFPPGTYRFESERKFSNGDEDWSDADTFTWPVEITVT